MENGGLRLHGALGLSRARLISAEDRVPLLWRRAMARPRSAWVNLRCATRAPTRSHSVPCLGHVSRAVSPCATHRSPLPSRSRSGDHPTCSNSTSPPSRAGSTSATACALRVAPLTTALMVAARSDAAVEALPETASDEERALVFAKAIARRAVDRVGGRRRRRRQPGAGHARGHRRAARGLADLRGVPGGLRLEGPAAGCGKKRLRALADWHFGGGDRYCAACAASVPGLPGAAEPAGDLRRLAGLGPRRCASAASSGSSPAR